ncbi:phosphatidylinositol N-acetylglucosaminyltransferase subunit C [Brachionus plicatilis]|uniref:Phosphatidylinositol N-acetylglucosaminyltransferase subunit C n=1 Tax=Brachionus plicatilis TaxID=10195 RepID=A0A3M7SNC6_BRAPC|nr:phosphatidylinositol N-acetylglucosaminyltransferase subunit C [Brachionus plicatilis]
MKKQQGTGNQKYRQNTWTKKLFIRHPYPDNYVDKKTFLSLKRVNVNARLYTYSEAVLYSGLLLQQLSAVVVFVFIYVYLRNNLVKIENLAYFVTIPTFILAYLSKLIAIKQTLIETKKDLGNVLKFVLFTYGLSPILNSLTESISSDTIYALVALMLIVNLIFYDYDSSEATIASKTFSFNAALFACVCLASRFENSSFHTFTLLILAFMIFALFPEYRRYIENHYPNSIGIVTFICFFICLTLMCSINICMSLHFDYTSDEKKNNSWSLG